MTSENHHELPKLFRRQWNIILGLIAVMIGLSIGLALGLLAIFLPK